MRRLLLGLALGMAVAGCLEDPLGLRGTIVVERVGDPSDSVLAGAPGRPLAQPVAFRVRESAGRPLPNVSVRWSILAGDGWLEHADQATGSDGIVRADWVLGRRAGPGQLLAAEVRLGSQVAQAQVAAVATAQEVASLELLADTTPVRVAVPESLHAQAADPFGNRFVPTGLKFQSLDTTLAIVDSSGRVEARRRGYAQVVATAGGVADTGWVHAVQVVKAIVLDRDTVRFTSIGQQEALRVTLMDDQGLAVPDSIPLVDVVGTSVVDIQAGNPLVVRSVAEGVSVLILRVDAIARAVIVSVAQKAATVALQTEALSFDALNDTLRLQARVLDSLGVALANPHLVFASMDTSVALVDPLGLVRAVGNGVATVLVSAGVGAVDSTRVTVSQKVVRVTVAQDSLHFDALRAVLPLGAVARDRLDWPVAGARLNYFAADGGVASVDTGGNVRAVGNGATTVTVSDGVETTSVGVTVAQRPVRLILPDTIYLTALGDTATISATAVDSLGSAVAGPVEVGHVSDPAVVEWIGTWTVRAGGTGVVVVPVFAAGLQGQVVVDVEPLPAVIETDIAAQGPILVVSLDSLIPLSCRVRDRNGNVIDTMPSVAPSAAGRWTGQTCRNLRAQRSGFDTVRVQAGGLEERVPIVLAVRAIPSSPIGEYLQVDSLPAGKAVWAPTVRRNSRGQLEIYFAAYTSGATWDLVRSDLHRLVSSDGVHWVYDGVALQHSDSVCTLDGNGIENVSIVPRADGPGWRMFFSAGGFLCYGWQVLSAVSTDERTWVKEPGVRVSNGGTVPPAASVPPPWPVGEGMVTEQLSSGEWHMIVGGYEQIQPSENKFQLVEWRSSDQLNWSYVGPVLTTRDMPPGGQGTIYSPSIRQIAPGLWRMIFNGDDRSQPGWRGRIWSAVSTDQRSWQLEGELMGGPQTRLWYGSLVDDRLVLIREDTGDQQRLAIATMVMP